MRIIHQNLATKPTFCVLLTEEDAARLRDIINGLSSGDMRVRLTHPDALKWAQEFYQTLCELRTDVDLYTRITTESHFAPVSEPWNQDETEVGVL